MKVFDGYKCEYKARKDTKTIVLSIMSLNEKNKWETIEYMEKPIDENQRKGSFIIDFENEDGAYKFELQTDGEKQTLKGNELYDLMELGDAICISVCFED